MHGIALPFVNDESQNGLCPVVMSTPCMGKGVAPKIEDCGRQYPLWVPASVELYGLLVGVPQNGSAGG